MGKKIKKIVVNDQTFFWYYQQYVRHLPHHTSRLLIFNKANQTHIEVFFHTEDTWTGGNPLNEGLLVVKGEERYILNLNQPKYVSELIDILLNHYKKNQLNNLHIKNGNKFLFKMGYREMHEQYQNPTFRYIKE